MKRRDFVRSVVAAGTGTLLGSCARLRTGALEPLPQARRLDAGWRCLRDDLAGAERPGLDDSAWEQVRLPHTARIEALVTGDPGSPTYQWQGICWYRRPLRLGQEAAGKKVFLKFEAAMNVAQVGLDGEPLGQHLGGFLPFVFDISDRVTPGREQILAVRLDNRDNPITGPKPLEILDFNLYRGLYRYVHLIVKDPLHHGREPARSRFDALHRPDHRRTPAAGGAHRGGARAGLPRCERGEVPRARQHGPGRSYAVPA